MNGEEKDYFSELLDEKFGNMGDDIKEIKSDVKQVIEDTNNNSNKIGKNTTKIKIGLGLAITAISAIITAVAWKLFY